MTDNQKRQWNRMQQALRRIARVYQTPIQLRRSCERQYGLPFDEALEMAYENIQAEAAEAVRGIKYLKIEEPRSPLGPEPTPQVVPEASR